MRRPRIHSGYQSRASPRPRRSRPVCTLPGHSLRSETTSMTRRACDHPASSSTPASYQAGMNPADEPSRIEIRRPSSKSEEEFLRAVADDLPPAHNVAHTNRGVRQVAQRGPQTTGMRDRREESSVDSARKGHGSVADAGNWSPGHHDERDPSVARPVRRERRPERLEDRGVDRPGERVAPIRSS